MRFLVIVLPSGGYANATLFEQQGCARAESSASVSPINANLKCIVPPPLACAGGFRGAITPFHVLMGTMARTKCHRHSE
jgi:hypothetical protein